MGDWSLKPSDSDKGPRQPLQPLLNIGQLQELQNTGAWLSEPQPTRPLLFLA